MKLKIYKSPSYKVEYDIDTIESYIRKLIGKEAKVVFWGTGLLGSGYGYRELKKRGIVPDFFCDNNREKWDKEVIDGIYCYSFDKLMECREDCICIVTVAVHYFQDVADQLQAMGVKHILPYDVLFRHFHVGWDYFPFIKDDRIAAYTCVIGDYDDILEPHGQSELFDFYLISDKAPTEGSRYMWIDIKEVVPEDIMGDYTRMNRYCKINAHKIFPNYRRSLYYDGNVELTEDMTHFFDSLPKTRIGVTTRNIWGCIYEEAMTLIEQRRDLPEKVYEQVKGYWLEGFPKGFGMGLNNILVREHNHPICKKIMEQWWSEVKNKCRRDQISLPYVLWKNGFTMKDLLYLTEEYLQDRHWKFHIEHHVSRLQDLKMFLMEKNENNTH